MTTEERMTGGSSPQEVAATQAPAPRRPSRKALLISVGALVTAVVAVIVGLSFTGGGSKDLTVTFSLRDVGGTSTCKGGTGGYGDIGPGTAVVVRDNGNQIIGTAKLGDGVSKGFPEATGGPAGCVWQTIVKEVPTGKQLYSVEVGRRGGQVYSASDLDKWNWMVDVSLGGTNF